MAPVAAIRATELAHALVAERLRPGDIAVDGTAGKGRDTLALAQAVGADGHVHAFDIQPAAIASTRNLLEAARLLDRVSLHLRTHAELAEALPSAHRGRVAVAVFNLGYLPSGDAAVVTRPQSTATALRAACAQLRAGGRLICVAYTGHPGGAEESEAVQAFAVEREGQGDVVMRRGLDAAPGRPWVLSVTRP